MNIRYNRSAEISLLITVSCRSVADTFRDKNARGRGGGKERCANRAPRGVSLRLLPIACARRVSYFCRGREQPHIRIYIHTYIHAQSRDQNATPRSARSFVGLAARSLQMQSSAAELISPWLGCQLHTSKTITDTSVALKCEATARARERKASDKTDLRVYNCSGWKRDVNGKSWRSSALVLPSGYFRNHSDHCRISENN